MNMVSNMVDKFFIKENFIVSHRKRFDKMKPLAHYHNTLEVFLLIKGRGEFFIKDHTYKLKPGTVLLIDEYDIHKSVYKDRDVIYDRIIMYLNKKYVYKKIFKIIDNFQPEDIFNNEISVLLLSENQLKEFVKLVENIILEQTEKKAGYRTIIRGCLLNLFVLLHRKIQECSDKGDNLLYSDKRVYEIIQYLNMNYKNNIELERIADIFCLNKYYFCDYFKRKTGFTVIEYINNKRVMEAQKLLTNSSKTITDISFEVGFNSLTHFDRTFKKLTGITPTHFRKIKTS